MKYVMGIDVGTTGCKATVFQQDGGICTQSYKEYPIPSYNGMISPELVWECVQDVICTCTQQYPKIEAVCTTSFGESVVSVDRDGKVLCDSFLYTNSNAEEEWLLLNERIGTERIYDITGYISHPMYTVSRLMWMRRNQRELYDKTDKFLFFGCFVAYRLCGKAIAEDTHAARGMMYDIRKEEWSREILEAARIEPEKLPQIVRAGEILGTVLPDVQKRLGMEKPALVIAGGQDQPCVALGLGAVQGGDAALGLGTVECLTLVQDRPRLNINMKENNFVCSPHVVPGKYVTFAVLYSGGSAIRDIREKYYSLEQAEALKTGEDIYDKMMEEAIRKETEVLVLPHLEGSGTPDMQVDDVGVIYGLHLSTTRGEILRGMLEGLAFDMRRNLECLEKGGLEIKHIVTAGGGAKNKSALQIRADAMQRKLEFPADVQAGTRGVFLIAAKSLKWIEDYGDIPCILEGCVEPAQKGGKIDTKYLKYLKLYQLLQEL